MLIVIITNGKKIQNKIITSITHPKRSLLLVNPLSVYFKKIIRIIIKITYNINRIMNAVHRIPSNTRIKIRSFNSLNGGKIKFMIPNTKVIIIANTKKTPKEFLKNIHPRISINALKASIGKNYFK